ncbi:hypothetical protein Q9R46_20920 [Paenibacillus sp. RRE4]|uniref:hypothetical protein n=1 Tax=Paenibacillus sp. RRE4 TaxID=2962587 RepID=UPI00288103DD|nr:hypothetical protein [Paenibacillus sp. RRE4]MDT0125140.1 hypothetical protein [Paenibacillus sp. RRE4]
MIAAIAIGESGRLSDHFTFCPRGLPVRGGPDGSTLPQCGALNKPKEVYVWQVLFPLVLFHL